MESESAPPIELISEVLTVSNDTLSHAAEMRNALIEHPDLQAKAVLRDLGTMRRTVDGISKLIAIQSVKDGVLKQTEAAELLGVHPNTIGRWLTASEVDTITE